MTTSSHDQAIRAGAVRVSTVSDLSGGLGVRLRQGDLVFTADMWVLLSVMWCARFVTGTMDPSIALFGIVVFLIIVCPRPGQDRIGPSMWDEVGSIAVRAAAAYAVASVVAELAGIGDPRALLLVAATTLVTLTMGRGAAYAFERAFRREGRSVRTLVVGGGEVARRVVATLAEHDEYGLEVVGVADDDPKLTSREIGTRILGSLRDVTDIVARNRVEAVIVAYSSTEQASMVDTIREVMARGVQMWVVPRFFELGATGTTRDHLWGLPLVRLQPPPRSRPEWALKRALDFVLALICLIVAAPLMAVIAVATYLDSGRPIFLRQERAGLDGRPFEMLKFRTMRVADETVEAREWSADRQRVTRVGRLLRTTSLDELPQLFNVLRGDMSLVGPRPERPYFVELFTDLYPNYDARHRLPAGVTGWAQVHGLRGGDTSIEERAAFDNYYIENWSLGQDLKILVKTPMALVRRKERRWNTHEQTQADGSDRGGRRLDARRRPVDDGNGAGPAGPLRERKARGWRDPAHAARHPARSEPPAS
jgi:exopolysaccharide biosynthesis polyprenyl glycosylphosphotransferase